MGASRAEVAGERTAGADGADESGAGTEVAGQQTIPARELLGYERIPCDEQPAPPRQLVLKQGEIFLLTDAGGNVIPAGACDLGFFQGDTRFLSHYDLKLAGVHADVLSSQASRVFSSQIDLTISDAPDKESDFTEPKNFLHVRRNQLLDGFLIDRIILTNFMGRPVEVPLTLEFAADYADIFEVRGAERPERGRYYEPRVGEREVEWRYRGLDGRVRRTVLRFSRPPDSASGKAARWNFAFQPKETLELEIRVLPLLDDEPARDDGRSFEDHHSGLSAAYERWHKDHTKIRGPGGSFDAALAQSVTDLRALMTRIEGGAIMTAGIPWFTAPFGRDSLITSFQTLMMNADIARKTLRFLAARQGRKTDEWTAEEPGKILHELRRGEMAGNGEIPHVPYYGTIDATPLFIILLNETVRWTGDEALLNDLMPAAERALAWIDEYGDVDGDGFVEYSRRSRGGLVNQGWKDSGDGVPFPDGTLPRPPIALVEVQGYVYAAKRHMAEMYEHAGKPEKAAELREQAVELRTRISNAFWMEDEGYFALALDGQKQPLRTLTSNPGHLLWAGVPTDEQARRMAEKLVGTSMFSGWGIRTLARYQPVYNPLSYHNGTVWPHDNSIIGLGLARYGFRKEAAKVLTALFEAALYFRYHRLPELFCGNWRGETDTPVEYPVSCSPQAWASGAFYPLLQGVLGIEPDARKGMLRLDRPYLPAGMRELAITDMRIGGSRVSLEFARRGERTMANVVAVEGNPLHVRLDVV